MKPGQDRLVVDTNVLVSGLLSPFGPPGVIVGWIAAGRLRLCYDARILAEYDGVLRRPAFSFPETDVMALTRQIQALGELVVPAPLSVTLEHEDDRPFLEVAHAAMAEYLVTGSPRHFPDTPWNDLQIVSPREFLDRFNAVA